MTFDPLNAARTPFGKLPPDDQEAFRELTGKGLRVQLLLDVRYGRHYWTDTDVFWAAHLTAYRICPRALAIYEISQIGGGGEGEGGEGGGVGGGGEVGEGGEGGEGCGEGGGGGYAPVMGRSPDTADQLAQYRAMLDAQATTIVRLVGLLERVVK